MKEKLKIHCAKCGKKVCSTLLRTKGTSLPANCPQVTKQNVIEKSLKEYEKPEIHELARIASVVEFENYEFIGGVRSPGTVRTVTPRIEETVKFAKRMGFKKLGIAFCSGLHNEAGMLTEVLENKGFDVVSVACKAGSTPKERIGIKEEEKIGGPGFPEVMCSPITQAELMNSENIELAILFGLCVGHDTLFLKYCKVPVTVLAVKDRVFGHNPVMGLYLSQAPYYGRLRAKEPY